MRRTIELPEALLIRAKSQAAAAGISLGEFLIQAIQQKLAIEKKKTRRTPPAIGGKDARRIGVLTPKQVDEAMFG